MTGLASAPVRHRSCIAVVLLVVGACVTARAQAAVGCTVTAIPVAFGTYDPLSSTPRTAAGRVTLRCTATGIAERVAASIALSPGLGGSFVTRTLLSGPNALGYNLFTSTAYTLVWGDGSAGTRVVSAALNVPAGATRTANRTVYGRIPALQNPAAGSFADTIVVTVSY